MIELGWTCDERSWTVVVRIPPERPNTRQKDEVDKDMRKIGATGGHTPTLTICRRVQNAGGTENQLIGRFRYDVG